MPQPQQIWKVLPHGKLTQIDDGLLTVVGDLHMPLGDFPRRMTVVRLRDGRLVIYSAIALDEPEMQALEDYGVPSFLIVPGDLHRLDAKIWKERYPNLQVIAPEGARHKIEETVRVDETSVDFGDPNVRFCTVPGTDEHESALLVDTDSGTTLIVNDLIWNMDHRPGFGGWIFRVAGFTAPHPTIPPLVALRGIKDKSALREQLERWARHHNLNRIIVSHGEIIRQDAQFVLRELAEQLAA
jgi:hypothetical protein